MTPPTFLVGAAAAYKRAQRVVADCAVRSCNTADDASVAETALHGFVVTHTPADEPTEPNCRGNG